MAGRLAVDTTFLIDLHREREVEEGDRPAHQLLRSDPEVELYLPAVALAEFAQGFDDPDDPALRLVRDMHTLLPIDEKTALVYGRISRGLRSKGRSIGANDLWIGATSLRHGLPLATRNVGAFRRIDGLDVRGY